MILQDYSSLPAKNYFESYAHSNLVHTIDFKSFMELMYDNNVTTSKFCHDASLIEITKLST